MAAFALGLIGEGAATDALTLALKDQSPLVQGRAAEALAAVGATAHAAEIAAMMRPHVDAGVLRPIGPDDLTYPMAPAVEAVRLGVYALTRLKTYRAARLGCARRQRAAGVAVVAHRLRARPRR